MPIHPDLRAFYRSAEWRMHQARIRERAAGQCEFCGKPANRWVAVRRDRTGRWNRLLVETLLTGASPTRFLAAGLIRWVSQEERYRPGVTDAWFSGWWMPGPARQRAQAAPPETGRVYLINRPLSVAHLNHDHTDNSDTNLAGICEYCHLTHDAPHHKETRATRKDRERPILAALATAL